MKILNVKINNIASFEENIVIDFEQEPLKSTGIFVISGATGAGKSTILDAICLALYNKTPRLNLAQSTIKIDDGNEEFSINNVKNLLRKGASWASVSVRFSAQNQVFTSNWSIRRSRNKAKGSIQQEEIILTNESKNEIFAERRKSLVLAEIERIIGLSFDEFTKSVLLAQGDFTSFLKAKDEERSLILEKLTGTEIYSKISEVIHQKNGQHQKELFLLNEQLTQIDLLSQEQENSLTENKQLLENQLITHQKNIEFLQENIAWHNSFEHLNNQISQINDKLLNAISEKENKTKDFETLHYIDKIQAIKNDFCSKKSFEKDLVQKEENINHNSLKINELEEKITHLNTEKENTEKNFNQITAEFNEQKPLIEQAKKLDTIISEKELSVNEKQTETDNLQKKIADLNEKFVLNKEKTQKGTDLIKNIELWQEKNAYFSNLKENYPLILKIIEEKKQIDTDLPTLKNKISEKEAQKEEILKNINSEKQSIENIDYNFSQIQQKEKSLENEKEIYQNDKKIIEKIEIFQNEIKNIENKINISENEKAILENETKKLKNEIETTQKEVEISEKWFQKWQLIQSENLQLLRNQLVEGEECPLCGAAHHPFATEKIHDFNNETEKELKLLKEKLNLSENNFAVKSTRLAVIIEEITTQKERNSLIINQLNEEENKLKKSEKFAEYPLENKTQYIENQLIRIKNEQENLRNIASSLQKINLLENNFQLNQKELENLYSEKEKSEKKIINFNTEIKKITTEDFLIQLYENNSNEFEKFTKNAVTEWNDNEEKRKKYQIRLNDLEKEFINIEANIKKDSENLENSIISLKNDKNNIEKIKNERKNLLNNENTALFEKKYTDKITILQEEFSKQNDNYTKNIILLEKLKISQNEFIKSKEEISLKINDLNTKIDAWIKSYFLENQAFIYDNLENWANYSYQWLQEEKEKLQQIENAILENQTLLNDKKTALEIHIKNRQNTDNQEVTKEKYEKETSVIKSVSAEITTISNQLFANNEKKKNFEQTILKRNKKEEIATKWAKLDALIGSANGKKFRIFAQEYTLDVLLQHANFQLKNINKRYTLARIPNSLSLQVVDNQMGNEIRSVYSLSGGESFLISLALALGLSSLSSKQMNVETLFIDEGFGTLDSQTLSVALDALENLQQQGKKIGIISHIQEMMERIPVKIWVKKEQNGKSSVEII